MTKDAAVRASNILAEIDSLENIFEILERKIDDPEAYISRKFRESVKDLFLQEIAKLEKELEEL